MQELVKRTQKAGWPRRRRQPSHLPRNGAPGLWTGTPRRGCLNISSKAGQDPVAGSGHYSAAKAGVNSLTVSFARELGPRVRVNCIMPGAVPTEIMMKALRLGDDDLPQLEKALKLPAGRLGTPEDLGAAALFLVSRASDWVTGEVISVSGGM